MGSRGHGAFCEHPSCCMSSLEVADVVLVGYEVFLMVLDLGTLVSGPDDVP
jgi:hypothetical protein